MRHINSHKVNPANDIIDIRVTDEPGSGGACHQYQVFIPHQEGTSDKEFRGRLYAIDFQNGPINENGINGLTHEALIAIVIDRLQGFQKGPYACRENALALTKLEEAKHWLFSRTLERMQRGVEGTHEK